MRERAILNEEIIEQVLFQFFVFSRSLIAYFHFVECDLHALNDKCRLLLKDKCFAPRILYEHAYRSTCKV